MDFSKFFNNDLFETEKLYKDWTPGAEDIKKVKVLVAKKMK